VRQTPASQLWEALQNARVATDRVGEEVVRLRITSRWARLLGFEISAYIVGELLVDTGFSHVRKQVLETLDGTPIGAICCTHSHEDHTGNCAPLRAVHGCPVYLRNAGLRWCEGVRKLKPYRAWWWGSPDEYDPEEMPAEVTDGSRVLRSIPAPGHSVTHVALWEETSSTVFTGDLFIAPGASAVMTQENPYDLVDSLRRVASVEPRLMLTGHGLVVENAARRLRVKADRVEAAAARAVELHRAGMPERTIVRELFPRGNAKDRLLEAMTQGEFARVNFVRAAVVHRRES
jgi:glyoxylase-like metal-dependent hydrolase (beta-lactamase superfamily II)